MKSNEQEILEQEYKNSFCNAQGSTIEHLKVFIEDTNSSNLPAFLKARFTDTANKDIKAITSLMDLQLEQGLERIRELKENAI